MRPYIPFQTPDRAVWRAASRVALVAGLAAGAACAPDPLPPPRLPAPNAADEPTELERAVDTYHQTGELSPLQAWLRTHPGHPDAELWTEVVALRHYEAATFASLEEAQEQGPEVPMIASRNPAALTDLVQRYPETFAGQTARAVLEHRAVKRLFTGDAVSDAVIAFLDHRRDWLLDEDGEPLAPNLDVEAFRADKEEVIRERAGDHLVHDGCAKRVGVCTWWVQRYPNAAQTQAIQADLGQIWWNRGHPPWQGKAHLQCAFDCARECRANAVPLDDSCYDPCYARC